MVDAEDAKLLNDVHEFLLTIAKAGGEKQGQSERVKSAEYRGVTGWSFGPNESHAIVGNRLMLSNKPEVLRAVADLRAGAVTRTLRVQRRIRALDPLSAPPRWLPRTRT